MPFSSLGLSESLISSFSRFPKPTPIQTAAIPVVLNGEDLLATSQTGSGKTAAYVAPLLQQIVSRPKRHPIRLHTLILVPTRELAAQVRDVVNEFSKSLPERVKVVSAVGGASINPQMLALRGGADIVVATPGRLLDLVDKNALNISSINTLVLDEADRMLDFGFADEIDKLLSILPDKRQNLLFSATFSDSLGSLVTELLNNPKRIDIPSIKVETLEIDQRAIRVDQDKRTPLLRHLIQTEGWEQVLVFVAKQYSADHVAEKLQRKGIDAHSFHGALSQGSRQEVLDDFKEGKIQVLLATDLAARGIDIANLAAVVNYDLPRSTVDYTHRIGRTGRAGKSGVAISFVTAQSFAHFSLIEKREKYRIPREEIEGFKPKDEPIVAKGIGGIKGKKKSKKDKLREKGLL